MADTTVVAVGRDGRAHRGPHRSTGDGAVAPAQLGADRGTHTATDGAADHRIGVDRLYGGSTQHQPQTDDCGHCDLHGFESLGWLSKKLLVARLSTHARAA